ncbi:MULTISPECIES: hypothetical protein [Mammaliicoccus]|nr:MULTISPECIES: hypothetical protein [Mammaliicoccus]MCJ0913088.1 hypothetical protein [Mammaliicoccus sciuri]
MDELELLMILEMSMLGMLMLGMVMMKCLGSTRTLSHDLRDLLALLGS